MAGRKHSEDDNWSGTPKFTQRKWSQQQREAARKNKMDKSSNKANKNQGKGKR